MQTQAKFSTKEQRRRQPKAPIEPAGAARASAGPRWLANAIEFGNRFVSWQAPYGGPDPARCPYRTGGKFGATHLHTTAPVTRALYRLYEATGTGAYKAAADRYAVFHLNAVRDPYEPYFDEENLTGEWMARLSRSWLYGKALSPCYEYFRRHNPDEDAFDIKAYACYRWMQRFRVAPEAGYFHLGYGTAQVLASCDLGEAAGGLIGFYKVSKYKPVLDDSIGLAKFFLTEYRNGSTAGVWSSTLGTWLLGTWEGGGGEHTTNQLGNRSGWGWSTFVVGEFLMRLHPHLEDAAMRREIGDKCVRAMRWCFDDCQFADGAVGMFGRDDKWVGMAAAAILMYTGLKSASLLPGDVEAAYLPKVRKSWQWLLDHTGASTWPPDGYIRMDGTTSKRPPENLVWLMAWTVEALLDGGKIL